MNHCIITNNMLFQSDRKLFLEMITKTQSQIKKITEKQNIMFNQLQTDRNIQHGHYMNKVEKLITLVHHLNTNNYNRENNNSNDNDMNYVTDKEGEADTNNMTTAITRNRTHYNKTVGICR
jgi:cell division protein FtsX